MKHLLRAFALLFLLILAAFTQVGSVSAAESSDFSLSYIRLDRIAPAVAPGRILVVVTPESTLEEGKLHLFINSNWTISSSASDFTVSTSDLPEGVQAWPGIAPAVAVTNHTVTFPSNDLTQGQTYGFYLTGGVNTNPSTANSFGYEWTIRTTDTSGSNFVQVSPIIPVSQRDQVQISATVLPLPSNFPIELNRTGGSDRPNQDSTLEFELKYGNNQSTSSPMTLQASWTEGRIEGSEAAAVEILDYVPGSATRTANGTVPVVDTVRRTITWTIPSVPGKTTNQTVRFSLKTRDSYTGSNEVRFSVSGQLIHPIILAEKKQDFRYTYSLPTSSPAPSPEVTPVPRDNLSLPPEFSQVAIASISETEARVHITTSQRSRLTLRFGASPQSLNKTIQGLIYVTGRSFVLDGLQRNTNYYFVVEAENENGIKAVSDVYTFVTASALSNAKLLPRQTLITSSDIPLLHPAANASQVVVVPIREELTPTLYFEHHEEIQTVSVEVTDSVPPPTETGNVLGSMTIETRLVEIQPGVFSAPLLLPHFPGWYYAYLKVHDHFGNITSTLLSKVYVSQPLTVVNTKGEPVEGASLLFYQYNEKTQLYEKILPQTLLEENPMLTDMNGQVPVVLPPGRYQVEVSRFGYEAKSTFFTIGDSEHGSFPTIVLDSAPLTLGGITNYYREIYFTFFRDVYQHLLEFSRSAPFFHFAVSLTLFFFGYLTLLAFLSRASLTVRTLPHYLQFHWRSFLSRGSSQNKENWWLEGRVLTPQGKSVPRAEVSFFSHKDKTLLTSTSTDPNGYFRQQLMESHVLVQVSKPGNVPLEKEVTAQAGAEKKPLIFTLEPPPDFVDTLRSGVRFALQNMLSFVFEALLVVSFLLFFFFASSLGWGRVFPFFILSAFNLILWMVYLYEKKKFIVLE